MRGIITFIVLFCGLYIGNSQTVLTEGDIAITGVNGDNPDQFSFVLLTDILNTTTINFTDKSWLAVGGFRLNAAGNPAPEGIVTWTATSDLPCGTEVTIGETGAGTSIYTATTGTAVESEGGFALSAGAGDQLMAYQGTRTNPTFLYAVHFGNGNGWTDSTDNSNSALPAGLTAGVNAIDLGDNDNSNYLCTVTSNQALILDALATVNATNWYQTNSNSVANRPVLGGCTYTCSAAGSCPTTVTWNGTWSGTPDLTTQVIIAANYNTSLGSFQACSLTVNAGARLTVDNGTYVEVENDVTVDGQIYVETQGNFVQNDVSGTFTNNGISLVNKSTAIKADWYYYTYWSSPVVGETIAGAFPNTDESRRFSFNASNFIDANGDDIDDNGDDWTVEVGGNIMTAGVGYAATSSRFAPYPSVDNGTFTGAFNTGDVTTGISYNVINTSGSWNFIGNPYPSAIDFIAFQTANSSVIDGAAYFWSQSLPPDVANPGNEVYNFSQNDYATFTVGTGGAAGASGIIPNQYIPSGQGFFVLGLANGNVTFKNAMRMADGTSNNQFFRVAPSKKNSQVLANKIWIDLTSDNGVYNQILIGYVDGATNENDGLFYDAPRNLSVDASAILYSNIDNETKKFVIQGKNVNSINKEEVISIGYKTSIEVPTIFTLSIAQIEGDFLNDNAIYLKDNLLNTIHNLKESDYNFTSDVGEFNQRFEIVFSQDALSLVDNSLDEKALTIIEHNNGYVQFKLNATNKMSNIKIIDLQGRILYNYNVNGNDETLSLTNLSSAPYIAKVTLDNNYVITKKTVKRH